MSIRLSKKHGVNPAIPVCFLCQEKKNEIILCGRLKGADEQAPQNAVWDMEPCDKCKEWMAQGIILISVRDGETDMKNPYRTGGWTVIKEEAFRRMFKGCDEVLKKRVAFLPDEVWNAVGLPRG